MNEDSLLHQSHRSNFLSEKKYLHHFETINTPTKNTITRILSTQTPNKNYVSKLESYSQTPSLIDRIMATHTQYHPTNPFVSESEFVLRPMLVNLHPKVKQNVQKTIEFFNNKKQPHVQNLVEGALDLPAYINSVSKIELRRRQQQQKMEVGDFEESPVVKVKEVEPNLESTTKTERNQRMKRIDLLLVEIMREKKRKGLVSDYFHAMEMKLIELLEYIIQDEPDYHGLTVTEKMKEILKNLENFKGRTIDGESKVNMLRIFFEEFRNLKGEKEEHEKQENKLNPNKERARKKSNVIETSGKAKSKVNMETMSMGRKRKETQHSKPQSVKKEDEWIGSLE